MAFSKKQEYINGLLKKLGEIEDEVGSASLDELVLMRDETRSDLHRGFIDVVIQFRKEQQGRT